MAISLRDSSGGGKTASGLNLTVNAPAGALVGDLMVLWVLAREYNGTAAYQWTPTTPTGWTEVETSATSKADDNKELYCYSRVKVSGDSSWTINGAGTACVRAWAMAAFTGHAATSPIPTTAAGSADTSETAHIAPTITTSAANSWMVSAFTSRLTSGTPPVSMTLIQHQDKPADGSSFNQANLDVRYELIAAAGATGTRTFTVLNGTHYASMSIEIVAATSGTVQTVTGVTAGTIDIPLVSGLPKLSTGDADATTAEAFASEANRIVLLATLNPLTSQGAGGTEAQQALSDGFASASYSPTIESWPEITRALGKGDEVGGGVSTQVGQLLIRNPRDLAPDESTTDMDPEGELDVWATEYVWDQRAATFQVEAIRLLDDSVVAGPLTILECRTKECGPTNSIGSHLAIALTGIDDRLQQKAQTVQLAGTGSDEGGAELKGVRAPIQMGYFYNAPGVCIDKANQVYLVSRDSLGNQIKVQITTDLDDSKMVTFDGIGPAESLTAVYIGSNPIDADNYTATVTTVSTIDSTVRGMLEYVLTDIGPLAAADLDDARLDRFEALYPFTAGWSITGEESIAEVLNAITAPIAAWGPNADGLIEATMVTDPDTDFVDHELPEDAIFSVKPIPTDPPAKSVTTGWKRNWNVVSEDGVTAAARATERGRWSQQPHYRIPYTDDGIADRWPSARTPDDFVLPLVEESDAEVVAGWIQAVQATPWAAFEVECDLRACRFQPGRIVEFSWPRWGLDTAQPFRILSVKISRNVVTLLVWRLGVGIEVLGGNASIEVLATETGAVIGP